MNVIFLCGLGKYYIDKTYISVCVYECLYNFNFFLIYFEIVILGTYTELQLRATVKIIMGFLTHGTSYMLLTDGKM